MKRVTLLAVVVVCLSACASQQKDEITASGLKRSDFQTEVDGKQTDLYQLTNDSGMEVCVTNYGGRVVSVLVPGNDGVLHDVVLGFDNIDDYLKYPSNYGATIGRYANRIAKGRFVIDNDTVQLEVNDYGNTLHGGPQGWSDQVFDAGQPNSSKLTLTYVSPDGESGFPGTVQAQVTYELTNDNALCISYEAVTNQKTIINLTNHTYFNLSDDPSTTIADHILWIAADSITPIDSLAIPIGDPIAVKGTPFDFTSPKPIGQALDSTDWVQIRNGIGYDHNWVLNTGGDITKPAVRLTSPVTGIVLEIFTTEPGMQFYSGNYEDGSHVGKRGVIYPYRGSMCLEPHHAPDSPNHPSWPSVRLDPGQLYGSRSIYRFSVAD